jgi:glucose/arabinose dehydrogenase
MIDCRHFERAGNGGVGQREQRHRIWAAGHRQAQAFIHPQRGKCCAEALDR